MELISIFSFSSGSCWLSEYAHLLFIIAHFTLVSLLNTYLSNHNIVIFIFIENCWPFYIHGWRSLRVNCLAPISRKIDIRQLWHISDLTHTQKNM
jgi:hypothetical protein